MSKKHKNCGKLVRKKLELTVFPNYGNGNFKKIKKIEEQLEKNLPGLTVAIKQQLFAQKLLLESSGRYDMALTGWNPDHPDPMIFADMFVTNSSYNQMSYSNLKYDDLIKKAKTTDTSDLQTRWNDMLKAEKILFEDAAIAPVIQCGRAYLQKDYVKGVIEHKFGGDFSFK